MKKVIVELSLILLMENHIQCGHEKFGTISINSLCQECRVLFLGSDPDPAFAGLVFILSDINTV